MATVELLGGVYQMPSSAPQAAAIALLNREHRLALLAAGVWPTVPITERHYTGAFNGQIADIIKVTNTPARRRVTLLDHKTLRPVAQTWSDADTGVYTFTGLNPARRYLVIADDYTQTYNAAVADWVAPEVPE